MDEPVHSLPQPPLPSVGNGESETIAGRVFFVSSFVSRRSKSHVFSTVLSNLAESSKVLKTAQKREK
jgi:hypothetical protein